MVLVVMRTPEIVTRFFLLSFDEFRIVMVRIIAKKMKAEPSRLISRQPTENLQLSFVVEFLFVDIVFV